MLNASSVMTFQPTSNSAQSRGTESYSQATTLHPMSNASCQRAWGLMRPLDYGSPPALQVLRERRDCAWSQPSFLKVYFILRTRDTATSTEHKNNCVLAYYVGSTRYKILTDPITPTQIIVHKSRGD
jgi:hypothetical protein